MRVRWLRALAVALALGGCAFGSDPGFFEETEGRQILGRGGTLAWTEYPVGNAFDVLFESRGNFYLMTPPSVATDAPMAVLFVPIPETLEEDYFAQVEIDDLGSGVAYAFVWREGDSYRVLREPRAIVSANNGVVPSTEAFCELGQYGQCGFESRDALLGYYMEFVYPQLVAGETEPGAYVEITAPSMRRDQ